MWEEVDTGCSPSSESWDLCISEFRIFWISGRYVVRVLCIPLGSPQKPTENTDALQRACVSVKTGAPGKGKGHRSLCSHSGQASPLSKMNITPPPLLGSWPRCPVMRD